VNDRVWVFARREAASGGSAIVFAACGFACWKTHRAQSAKAMRHPILSGRKKLISVQLIGSPLRAITPYFSQNPQKIAHNFRPGQQ
jgi:hypothetical protein